MDSSTEELEEELAQLMETEHISQINSHINADTSSFSLDAILQESLVSKENTESALAQLAGLNGEEPTNDSSSSTHDLLLIVSDELKQLAKSQENSFETVSNGFRQAVDVIDNRVALATRVLSDKQDECVLSLTQLETDLNELSESVKNVTDLLSAFQERRSGSTESIKLADRLTEIEQQITMTLDQGNLGVARRQLELDNKLTRIEAQLSALSRTEALTPRGNIMPWLVSLLLLINGFMIIWLRFVQ